MHRFTVQQILAVTFACCLIFATCSALGISSTIALGVLALVATPSVALFAACVAKECTLEQRVVVAATISTVSLVATSTVAVVSAYRVLAPMAILGMLLLWLMQWITIGILYSIWKSGIDSVRRAEEEQQRKTKQDEK